MATTLATPTKPIDLPQSLRRYLDNLIDTHQHLKGVATRSSFISLNALPRFNRSCHDDDPFQLSIVETDAIEHVIDMMVCSPLQL